MTVYKVECKQNGCIVVSKNLSTFRFYRIPYRLLETRKHGIDPPNKFIVYLLSGKTASYPHVLYVGTSYRGIDDRPTAHEDRIYEKEPIEWESCIIFTTTDDFFNDTTIRYLENSIRGYIDDSRKYKSSTNYTSGGGANNSDKEACDTFLPTVLEIYSMLGIDLTSGYKFTLNSFIEEKEGKITTPEPKTDYSSLNLPLEMTEWLRAAESIALEIDSSIKSDVTKQYANYSCGKIFAYWYPLKSQNKFRVLLRGTAEEYNDPRVTPRPENVHNGDCKAMFYVSCSDDLKYFRLFAEKAILKTKTT